MRRGGSELRSNRPDKNKQETLTTKLSYDICNIATLTLRRVGSEEHRFLRILGQDTPFAPKSYDDLLIPARPFYCSKHIGRYRLSRDD
jgi:hypothetical protein